MKWSEFSTELIKVLQEALNQIKEKLGEENINDGKVRSTVLGLLMDEIYAVYGESEKSSQISSFARIIIKTLLEGKEINTEDLKNNDKLKTLFENAMAGGTEGDLWILRESILLKDYL